MNSSLFIIEYFIHDGPKAFIIRAETMNNAEAWHWACCDAGIGIIPSPVMTRSGASANPSPNVMALLK
ncbi:hypothetical protein ABMA08_17795 [Pseudomonas yamanorum]